MQLENVLERLGYSQSDNYKRADKVNSQTTHLFRGLNKKTEHIQGCYTFHTSQDDRVLPIRAAVYVAKANTENEARQIHKQLWNFNNAPFLIVVLPHQIRVYTGFEYSEKEKRKGEIRNPIESLADISQVLTSFFADSIDFGKIWQDEAKYLDPDQRVDSRLLKNLEILETYLVENQKLQRSIAQALIGKYIYIKYLREREILSDPWLLESNVNLDYVLGRDATVTELEKLVNKLEERFQGNVFPLDFKDIPVAQSISIVASIFQGDEIQDANTDEILIQLHLDFKAYDFSYIPIETLSAIYEQFLHAQGQGKKDGAIYTPEPVADYLLCEMNSVKPLELGMKILDPCCGSGIFLVLVYRKLIEKTLENSHGKLEPFELKDILVNSIYGVERNQEACYVAEFSLLLMMLNYIEPPELHKNKDFTFPSLHNKNIFVCDFFDNQSEFWKLEQPFDWIIGNPPWKEIKQDNKNKSEQEKPEEILVGNWINENSKNRPVADKQIAEAFTWRTLDVLQLNGLIGLLTPAKMLFNHKAEKYRQSFFSDNQVFRITNFANMAFVLFNSRIIVPMATLIYSKALSENNKPSIYHYAPFVANQIANLPFGKKSKQETWSIIIYENEIQSISSIEAEQGKSKTWKLALWGHYREKKSIYHIEKLFPKTIENLINEKQWSCHQGPPLRDKNTTIEPIDSLPEIQGSKILDAKLMAKTGNRLSIPDHVITVLSDDRCFVSEGRKVGLKISQAPHLVINPKYCVYSDKKFIIPHSQTGISTTWNDRKYLQGISVWINSSLMQYYLFFCCPSWGVERNAVSPKDIKNIPVPDFSKTQIDDLSILQKYLTQEELKGNRNTLQNALDSAIVSILNIPQSLDILSREFMQIRLSLNKGKVKCFATKSPSENNLHNYAEYLRYELDNFVEGSDIRHAISITTSEDLIICTIELYNSETEIPVKIKKANAQDSQFLQEIQQKLREKFSKRFYIQRGMRLFSDTQIHICKSPRLIDWTQTQAMYDSDDIIAEMLNRRKS